MLNLAHVHISQGINGPGRRFTVWVQGCARGCPGCFNPDLQPREPRRRVAPGALAEEALRSGQLDGVSLSGGEPFDQADGLAEFLDVLRGHRLPRDFTVLAFTGYRAEELRRGRPGQLRLLDRLDLLVDGPYAEAEAAVLPLRGSANQRLVPLSAAGRALLGRIEAEPLRRYEAMITEDGAVILTGFPPSAAVDALRANLGG